jgi:hypothetical protein
MGWQGMDAFMGFSDQGGAVGQNEPGPYNRLKGVGFCIAECDNDNKE